MSEYWIRPPMPSRTALAAWSRLLRVFRYYRHYGCHSEIEDEFVLALKPDAFTYEIGEKLHAIAQAHGQMHRVGKFSDRVVVSVTDSNGHFVTPQSVKAAIDLESVVQGLASSPIDPPIDSPNCFCPKYHPELWSVLPESSLEPDGVSSDVNKH